MDIEDVEMAQHSAIPEPRMSQHDSHRRDMDMDHLDIPLVQKSRFLSQK
jgi:hypothetical protein